MEYKRIAIFAIHAAVAVFLGVTIIAENSDAGKNAAAVTIGLSKTFLQDQPKSVTDVATDDFRDVLKKTTKLDGVLNSTMGALEVADKLQLKKLDFGIFHGHEFAWARKKHPGLKPLLVAVNRKHAEQAFVVVNLRNSAKTLADLRGKIIDIPLGTNEPSRQYLAKLCREAKAKDPAALFASISKSKAIFDALDGVARDTAQAVIIDSVNLGYYKEVRGPVFEKNLRVLSQSELFPPAMIAYLPGKVDETTLKQFRDGLLTAHTVPEGRDLMRHWRIDAFEAVPNDFAKSVDSVLKRYPEPNTP